MAAFVGCGADEEALLPNEHGGSVGGEYELVARFAHITDSQIVDEESPGRLSATADLNASAWRPQERFSIHLLDGTIRAINTYHDRVDTIDFVLFTGDARDNVQANEARWFMNCFDGLRVDPVSGVDDRPVDARGLPDLDPYVPFVPAGLYRNGVHGSKPSIPWYAVLGNHDRYAVGVFPLVERWGGGFIAPLPLSTRIGLFLPTVLIPDGSIAYGPITPAHPGPPPDVNLPSAIPASEDRRFEPASEFIAAHFDTLTEPVGHGFVDATKGWYSTSPVPGLRLIALDTSLAAVTIPTGVYDSGAVVAEQARFLREELAKAQDRDEIIIVATHHPSFNLLPTLGTSLTPEAFRATLNAYPNVVAHFCGHTHRHRVWNRGGYLELETSAIIDYPQEGRFFEIWRAGDQVEVRYTVFSHLYEGTAFDGIEDLPPADDPFVEMRREAFNLSKQHSEIHHLLPIYPSGEIDLPDLPDLSDLFRLRGNPGKARRVDPTM